MTFVQDIAAYLVAQGVGTLGANIFYSSASIVPVNGVGPYLTITETGGMAPTRVQNKSSALTRRPTAQILVRATTYVAALTMVQAAFTALDGVFNTIINGTSYKSITARQEPTDMGLDPSRIELVFNINAELQP